MFALLYIWGSGRNKRPGFWGRGVVLIAPVVLGEWVLLLPKQQANLTGL